MAVCGASVHTLNLEIMALLTSTPRAWSHHILDDQRGNLQRRQCCTHMAPHSPRIQHVSTYSLHPERHPADWPLTYNADRHPFTHPEVDSLRHDDARTAQLDWCNLVIHAGLPQPQTKNYITVGRFSVEWKGDDGNVQVPIWSWNPVPSRLKPHSVSDIQSDNWVHIGIVWIRNVCSIYISRWCKIEFNVGCVAFISQHLCRFLIWVSQLNGEAQSHCPENGTCKEANARRENNLPNLDPSKMWRETNAREGYIRHKTGVSPEEFANLKCPKIHSMSHWVKQICQ